MKRSFVTASVMLALLGVAGSSSALATNSVAELESVLEDLLEWWPGEWDTLPQVMLERQYGAPPDGEHDRQYRQFTRVDVPHLGAHVIYGEVRTGGPDGPLIRGQQVMYLISVDAERQVVNVNGRRIKGGAEWERVQLDPEKLKRVELDPDYGGNCDFRFRRYGGILRGHLANTDEDNLVCTMASRNSGQTMTWDADWAITPDEIWIFDNGYLLDPKKPNEPGRLFAGREDLTHERLYRINRFDCQSIDSAGVSTRIAGVSDRGGEFSVARSGGAPASATLLRMPVRRTEGSRLQDTLNLTVDPTGDSQPSATTMVDGDAERVSLDLAVGRVSCAVSR